MFYVYTLSHKGNIFYVGQSKDVFYRYVSHMNTFFTHGGIIPELDIIFHHKKKEIVSKCEKTAIKLISGLGIKLYNIKSNKGKRFNGLKNDYTYKMAMESRKYHHLYIKWVFINYLTFNDIKPNMHTRYHKLDLERSDFKFEPIKLYTRKILNPVF